MQTLTDKPPVQKEKEPGEVIRLPAAQAADRVAARADEQPALDEAIRAGLAAICEELDLVAARALVGDGPHRAIWHVAQREAVRFLLHRVREPAAPCEGLEVLSTAVPGGPAPLRIEAFAEPGKGRLRELASLCSSLGAVLTRKPSDDEASRYRRLFDEGPLPGWVLDESGAVLALNQAAVREIGYSAEELRGRKLREALRAIEDGPSLRCRRKDGTQVLLTLRQRSISFAGRPAVLEFATVPVTDTPTGERDALTGLASRGAFLQRLQEGFERSRSLPGATMALLFVDVDRFRRINNSVGTAAGDALLAQVAERIRGAIPPLALAARLGADEFTVLIENVRDPGQVLRTAERLHGVLRQPFAIEQIEVITTVSVGIAFSGHACSTPNELLRDADTAMSRARSRGPGRTVLWDATMSSASPGRLQLEADLRRALDRNELQVGYQPIVSLANGEITGFEALARWNHPQRGPIPPSAFVPVAEDAGLIERMSLSILRQACRHMRGLEIGRRELLTLSVNLSARQLLRPDLADEIAAVLADTGVNPGQLHVEVTESVLVENREAAAALLRRLRDMRVAIHLDDFGTGYSSLSYLHDLPIDALKIDRSFVVALRSGERARSLVGSIVALAARLGLGVIAEGIETEEQAQALRELSCPAGQGYLFGHAVPADQAHALLHRGANFWR